MAIPVLCHLTSYFCPTYKNTRMRIVIAGAGEVGFHLARLLAQEEQDIVLIDTEQERLDYAQNHIDVFTIQGDSTSYQVMREANIHKTDLLIAVTSSGDTNFTTCSIGKIMGAKKTIARISNPNYITDPDAPDLTAIGIDELISPESLAALEVSRLLKGSAFTDTFEFAGGKLNLVGAVLDQGAPLVGNTLIETAHLNPRSDFLTVAIRRGDETIIPHGRTSFKANDHVYFLATPEGVEQVLKAIGKKAIDIDNVMILGGSRTGVHAAHSLCENYHLKLLEKSREKSYELADELPQVLIINGDGTNVELLEEENISEMDAFVALTGNSETNILSCLVAKSRGVKKTVAMVENIEYIDLSQNIGIDTLINKKLIAANFIFRYIRKGNVVSLTGIHGMDAEILEFEVHEGAKITRKPIRDLNFPRSAIIGGVIRENREGMITLGNFQVQPGDHVVVFTLDKAIHKVEEFFK